VTVHSGATDVLTACGVVGAHRRERNVAAGVRPVRRAAGAVRGAASVPRTGCAGRVPWLRRARLRVVCGARDFSKKRLHHRAVFAQDWGAQAARACAFNESASVRCMDQTSAMEGPAARHG